MKMLAEANHIYSPLFPYHCANVPGSFLVCHMQALGVSRRLTYFTSDCLTNLLTLKSSTLLSCKIKFCFRAIQETAVHCCSLLNQ